MEIHNRWPPIRTILALALLLAAAQHLAGATATLVMTKQPAGTNVALFDTFTLTFTMSSYGGGGPVDGFNFQVNFDPARFALVPGAAALRDATGADENWLRLPVQENVGSAPILTDFQTNDTGIVRVAVCDLRLVPNLATSSGTIATTGFLCALTFQAIGTGPGAITAVPSAGGTFLFSPDLRPLATPAFSTNLTLNVLGPALAIYRTNTLLVVTWPTGVLQSATSFAGVWTDVAGANSPYSFGAQGSQRFFRLRMP
jgi:hypothetical protein